MRHQDWDLGWIRIAWLRTLAQRGDGIQTLLRRWLGPKGDAEHCRVIGRESSLRPFR